MSSEATRQILAEQLSALITGPATHTGLAQPDPSLEMDKQASLLLTASKMLKFAAKRMRTLEEDNEKLAYTNRQLQAQLDFDAHKARAVLQIADGAGAGIAHGRLHPAAQAAEAAVGDGLLAVAEAAAGLMISEVFSKRCLTVSPVAVVSNHVRQRINSLSIWVWRCASVSKKPYSDAKKR